MHASMASSAPFQIVSARDTGQPRDITNDSVRGAVVATDASDTKFLWLQTSANGKRLVCLTPTTLVRGSGSRGDLRPLIFNASDLPLGVTVGADGLWEDAHSRTCTGSGDDSAAPPRLRARVLRLAGSGILGTFQKCRSANNQQVCRYVSYMPMEMSNYPVGPTRSLNAQQIHGIYIAPIQPGDYYVYGRRVKVEPSEWSRLDIKLPD